MFLDKENLKLIKYLGIIYISILLSYKIPHVSFSIFQYIIKPIRFENSVLYLSSIVTLVLIIIGIKGIFKLERFQKRSKLIMVFLILFLVLPFMNWTIDMVRTGYYTYINPGIQAIDIEESHISLHHFDVETKIAVDLKLKYYSSRNPNEFKIRIYLPKTLSNYAGKEYIELENLYQVYGHNDVLSIHEDIPITTTNNSLDDSSWSDWYYEDVRYELYNDNEKISILQRKY